MANADLRQVGEGFVQMTTAVGKEALLTDAELEELGQLTMDSKPLDETVARLNEFLASRGEAPASLDGVPNSTAETNLFVDGAEAPKGRRSGGKRRQKGVPKRVLSKLITDEAAKLGETSYGLVASIIAKTGAVVGYVTATNEKIDIVRKAEKLQGGNDYQVRFLPRMSGPSSCKGFLVAIPANAFSEINKRLTGQVDDEGLNVEYANAPDQSFVLEAYTTETFISTFLTAVAYGSIRESDKLYDRYVMKKRSGKSQLVKPLPSLEAVDAEIEENDSCVAGKNALYPAVSYKADETGGLSPVTRVKHTFRTKLVTPHNYISARIFDTVPIEAAYSPEAAQRMNHLYLDRFLKRRFKDRPLHELIAPDDNNLSIDLGPTGEPVITASTFFPTSADMSYFANNPVPHWFYRKDDGNPEMVKLIGQGLVAREEVSTKKPGSTQIHLKYKELKADPGVDNYVIDLKKGGRHEAIGRAIADFPGCDLTFEFIEKFFRQAQIIKDRSSTGAKGREKAVANPRGKFAFGVSATTNTDAYQQAVREAVAAAKK